MNVKYHMNIPCAAMVVAQLELADEIIVLKKAIARGAVGASKGRPCAFIPIPQRVQRTPDGFSYGVFPAAS
jgi:hypothetical protein